MTWNFVGKQITEQNGTLVKAMICTKHSGHNKYIFRLVFCGMIPCSLFDKQCFGRTFCLHLHSQHTDSVVRLTVAWDSFHLSETPWQEHVKSSPVWTNRKLYHHIKKRKKKRKKKYNTTVQLSCLNATCDKTALLHTIVHHTTEVDLPPYAAL